MHIECNFFCFQDKLTTKKRKAENEEVLPECSKKLKDKKQGSSRLEQTNQINSPPPEKTLSPKQKKKKHKHKVIDTNSEAVQHESSTHGSVHKSGIAPLKDTSSGVVKVKTIKHKTKSKPQEQQEIFAYKMDIGTGSSSSW